MVLVIMLVSIGGCCPWWYEGGGRGGHGGYGGPSGHGGHGGRGPGGH